MLSLSLFFGKNSHSFTLIETLVVLAIVSILSFLAVSAFIAVAGAHKVAAGAYDVQELVELARDTAVTRQTYVWVGCLNTTAVGSGTPELDLAAVYSLDGSTNSAAANLVNLTKVLRVQGVVGTSWGSLKSATRNLYTNSTPASAITNTAGITLQSGTIVVNGSTITFAPRGEALLTGSPGSDDGYDNSIDISFRQAHGTSIPANADDASVVIDGATGNTTIVRLQ